MTYQLGQRKEFPLLIRLHQLLQPISKSQKSYLKDTTDFLNYIFFKRRTIEHFMFQWTSQVLANTPQKESSDYTLPAGNA